MNGKIHVGGSEAQELAKKGIRERFGMPLQNAFISIFILTLVFAMNVFSTPANAQGATEISFSPLVIPLEGQRGETVPFSVSVINNSTLQTARFKAFATGLAEGRGGDYSPVMPDDGPFAGSDWVRLEQ